MTYYQALAALAIVIVLLGIAYRVLPRSRARPADNDSIRGYRPDLSRSGDPLTIGRTVIDAEHLTNPADFIEPMEHQVGPYTDHRSDQ